MTALCAPSVSAQQAAETGTEAAPERVVVTAQKRTSLLQDVPFSVAAPSEEQIRNAGAASIVDLARNVAGLSIADLGPGQSQIAIRGISSGQVIRDQPGVKEQVGVYLDESTISAALFTPDLFLYDLDRFEVLRGPQGTLFGAGSEAGTLRYITKQPKLGKNEANIELTGDIAASGDGGGSAAGMLNIPLGEKLAFRGVAYYERAPGFIDAIQPGGSIKGNVNTETRDGARLALLLKPFEDLTIEPRYVYQKLSGDGYPRVDLYNILANQYTTTQPAITIGDRQQFTQFKEGPEDKFQLSDLKVDYDFGPIELTSVTSYTHRDLTILRDATQLTGSVTFQLGGTPADVRLNSPLYDRTKLSVLSQELRLQSSGKQAVDWLGGLFWQHIGRNYGQSLPTPGYDVTLQGLGVFSPGAFEDPRDNPFNSDLHYSLFQYAGFGEATWHVTDQWSATAGLRYYGFRESRNGDFGGLFAIGPCPGTAGMQPPCGFFRLGGSTDSHGLSPRAIVTYKLTPDIAFDAQVSRGFRLGGINDPLNTPLCAPSDVTTYGGHPFWSDEKAWNYELGAKTQLFNRKITLNASAFWTEIYDLQANTTAGSCSSRIVFNVPTAHSTGLEAELFARPDPNWDFGISATWVDALLTSSVFVPGTTTAIAGMQQGNRLPTAAKLQAVASIGYTRPLPSGRDLFSVFTLQYVGSSFSQFEQQQPGFGQVCGAAANCSGAFAPLIPFGGVPSNTRITFNPELPSYTLGNLRVGLKSNRWEVAGFVNNLWDETARLALDYERGRRARVGYLTNMPRLVGVTARYSF
jgi:iron complex outermembrane receptor protein